MNTINVEGLPDHVAAALRKYVEAFREKLNGKPAEKPDQVPLDLPQWPGIAYGSLRRADIYDDVG